MNVLKFNQYNSPEELAKTFLEILSNDTIYESSEYKKEKIQNTKDLIKKTIKDLKLNTSFVVTFGTGISLMLPIVKRLIENSTLNIEVSPTNMILLTITSFAIIYLEEKKNKTIKKTVEASEDEIRKNAKSLLEELKLKGIGNGIVKMVVSSFKSILNIVKVIFENLGNVATGFLDLFAYVSLMVPMLNAILALIGKYNFDHVTLPGNFLALGAGIATLIAKNGIQFLIDKLSNKFKLKRDKILKYLSIAPYKKYPHPELVDGEDEANINTKINEKDK